MTATATKVTTDGNSVTHYETSQFSAAVLVDAVAPTSSVAALPVFSPASFTVSWSGSDNTGGSGLATYDVYVSDNSGAFTAWLTGTTQTSAVYTGADGHVYGFYSVARPTPATSSQPRRRPGQHQGGCRRAPTSNVAALPALSPTSFTVSWSGSDEPAARASPPTTYTSRTIMGPSRPG